MIYTVIIDDRSYDLPKKTLAVTEMLDKAADVDKLKISTRDKYKRVLDCIVAILGQENTAEALGSTDLNELDLTDITITFRKIVDAYNKPVQDYVNASGFGALSSFPIEELTKLATAATQVVNAADAVKKE
jgi:hypothetical protein